MKSYEEWRKEFLQKDTDSFERLKGTWIYSLGAGAQEWYHKHLENVDLKHLYFEQVNEN